MNYLKLIVSVTKFLTGATGVFQDKELLNSPKQKIFFANHTSNMDTIVLWAALPGYLRKKTRPVAARDYWNKPGIRRKIAQEQLNVVLVDRKKELNEDPLDPLRNALKEGFNLIIFPEGQRNNEALPLEFKSGLYQLKQEFPDAVLVPVYLENVTKSFPKGALLPLPVICKAHFGTEFVPPEYIPDESDEVLSKRNYRKSFLDKARQTLISLAPEYITKR